MTYSSTSKANRHNIIDRYMSHMPDQVFKRIFTDSNSLPLLQDLVSAILGIPYDSIKSLSIRQNELAPRQEDGKVCRLDLLLDVDGTKVNIELQFGNRHGFAERTIYYLARIIEHELHSGEGYVELPQTICINIVDFPMFPTLKKYHTTFHFREDVENILLSDRVRIDFLELSKIPQLLLENACDDRKLLWMHFFKIRREEDIEMMYEIKDPKLRQAVDELRKTKSDDDLFYTLLSVEKYERDLANELAYEKKQILAEKEQAKAEGRAEGRAEGLAEGRAEGQMETRRDDIRIVLGHRFGNISLEQLNTVLNYGERPDLLTLVLQASSLEALIEELQKS